MEPEMTWREHGVAWAVYVALNSLRKSNNECAASCGCSNDPIIVIVEAMRNPNETLIANGCTPMNECTEDDTK
jgi:hypothetical protein